MLTFCYSQVFALNNLFTSLLLLILSLHTHKPTLLLARVGALTSGLALANQHTISLYILPSALHCLYAHMKTIRTCPGELLVWAGYLCVGLLVPYGVLGLVCRSDSGRMYAWGDIGTYSGASSICVCLCASTLPAQTDGPRARKSVRSVPHLRMRVAFKM